MIGDPVNLITVNWSVVRDGPDSGYVTEFADGQLALSFGPMPMAVTGAFILQRKQQVAAIFDRVVRRLNDGKDQTDEAEPLASEAVSER